MSVVAPSPNTPVGLHLSCCSDEPHPSRVDGVTASTFAVAAPHGHSEPPADPFVVSWAEGTAGIELPGRVVDTRNGQYPAWVLEPAGEPERVQRRQYVRIAESADSAQLRLFTSIGAVGATVLDLSEGGVRCSIPPAVAAALGERLDIVLTFDQTEISTASTLVRAHPTTDAVELALRFDELRNGDADRVRAHVFARQAHLRSAK